jgi:hypothetical protein
VFWLEHSSAVGECFMRVENDNVLFLSILICIIGFLILAFNATEESGESSDEISDSSTQINKEHTAIALDAITPNNLDSSNN